MGFGLLDVVVLTVYLAAITSLGLKIGGKQKNAHDYFLGSRRIPWWAACFAIVATETSALTFISIPGLAYLTNLNFLQLTVGYFLGRILVAYTILPLYFHGDVATAYTFLSNRFGKPMKNLASGVFLLTRLAADGVRLFATAIPLALLLRETPVTGMLPMEWIYILSILVIAVVSLSYTYVGGLRAVVWMDVVQLCIYLAGAVVAIVVLGNLIPGGIPSAIATAADSGKCSVFNFSPGGGMGGFISSPYTFVASILGGAFLSMASHGVDQLIVQRLLATGSLEKSRRALILTGVIIIIQFALFMFLGLLLYVFYGGADIPSDEVFPLFIIQEMPSGLSGLIVAALFAAAMSTLSSSLSAMASATVYDFLFPRQNGMNPVKEVTISRLVTVMWSVLLVASAIIFMRSSQTVVELALSIASLTYGALLGSFLLGLLFRRPQLPHALLAFGVGMSVMVYVILFTSVAWTWYTLIGTGATVITGILCANLSRR